MSHEYVLANEMIACQVKDQGQLSLLMDKCTLKFWALMKQFCSRHITQWQGSQSH